MAITNGYATLAELKSYLSITDTNDDTELEVAVEAASRAIDDFCSRRFYTATETRYYTARAWDKVFVDDLVSVTTLKTDDDGDQTFETTWSTSDYELHPHNANTDGRPYTAIIVSHQGEETFPNGVTRGVEVAGTFGWPSVPTALKQACIIQAAKLFQISKDGGGGLTDQFGERTSLHAQSRYLERSTEMLVRPYRRLVAH